MTYTIINVTREDISATFNILQESRSVQLSVPAKSRLEIPDSYEMEPVTGIVLEADLDPPTTIQYASFAAMVTDLPFPVAVGTKVVVSPGFLFEVRVAGTVNTLNGTKVTPYDSELFNFAQSMSGYADVLIDMADIRDTFIQEIDNATQQGLVV